MTDTAVDTATTTGILIGYSLFFVIGIILWTILIINIVKSPLHKRSEKAIWITFTLANPVITLFTWFLGGNKKNDKELPPTPTVVPFQPYNTIVPPVSPVQPFNPNGN